MTRLWRRIIERDSGRSEMGLFITRIDIHFVGFESISSKAFVCRGAVKKKYTDLSLVSGLKYGNHMNHCHHELLQIPPMIMTLARIYNDLRVCHFELLIWREFGLGGNLFLR